MRLRTAPLCARISLSLAAMAFLSGAMLVVTTVRSSGTASSLSTTDSQLPSDSFVVHSADPLLLHHLYGSPSEIIVFGEPGHDRTHLILRHKEAKRRAALPREKFKTQQKNTDCRE